MTVTEPGSRTTRIIERVKGLLLKPTEEWTKIEAESTDLRTLFVEYVAPLAAIPVVAGVIGSFVFGISGAQFQIALSPVSIILGGILDYIFFVALVYLTALAIEQLAPTFSAKKDRMQALKASAYSWTALWLVGIVAIVPALWALSIVGLYSLFLLYRALPILVKAPQEQAIAYTGAVAVAVLVMGIIYAATRGLIVHG